jgi:hypothetical protein
VRSRNYYRVRLAVRLALALALLALILWIAGYVWWTGEGYCIGSMTKCLGDELSLGE